MNHYALANKYKNVLLLFGAAMHQIKAQQFYTYLGLH